MMEDEDRDRLSGKAFCGMPSKRSEVSTRLDWQLFATGSIVQHLIELYKIFVELDRNGDMRLDVSEINTALDRAGIGLHRAALEDFIASLASSSKHQGEYPSSITFPQFRDYLLLLPRKPSVNEVSVILLSGSVSF